MLWISVRIASVYSTTMPQNKNWLPQHSCADPASDQSGSGKVLSCQNPYLGKSREGLDPRFPPLELHMARLLKLHVTEYLNNPHMSLVMRKAAFCIYMQKQRRSFSCTVTAQLISAFVFATPIVQSLFFLNPKLQATSHLLRLCSPVCVRKP